MKENQRISVTKRMLKEGLLRLLKTMPLDKINIVDLCNESGINRTTFYRHYNLPIDIMKEMQADFVNEMKKSLKRPFSENDLVWVFEYMQKNADLVILFIRYNSDKEWTEMFRTLYQSVRDIQNYQFHDSESQQLFYTFLAGGTYFLLRQWLIEGIHKTPEELADIVLNIVDKSIVIDKK